MSGREIRRRSRLRVLLGAVPLAVLSLAPVPGSASAQTAGNGCEGKLTGEGHQAELSFSCNFRRVPKMHACRERGGYVRHRVERSGATASSFLPATAGLGQTASVGLAWTDHWAPRHREKSVSG